MANVPVDINEGAAGDQVLVVDLPIPIDEYEIIEDAQPYREWCVPANLINTQGTLTLLSQDEVDSLIMQRFLEARESPDHPPADR